MYLEISTLRRVYSKYQVYTKCWFFTFEEIFFATATEHSLCLKDSQYICLDNHYEQFCQKFQLTSRPLYIFKR